MKIKIPLLVKVIAILLIIFSIQILGLVFVSLYLHFFGGYPIPQNVSWGANLLFLFIVSVLIIGIAIGLFKRKNYARILAVISLFLISILNLKAELFNTDSPAIPILIIYSLFFLLALYLLFSKKVRESFRINKKR